MKTREEIQAAVDGLTAAQGFTTLTAHESGFLDALDWVLGE